MDMLAAIISDDYSDILTFLEGVAGLGLSEDQMHAMGMADVSPEAETQKLIDVETRLIELNDKIAAEFPDEQTDNPVQLYLSGKNGAHPYTGVLAQIDLLTQDLRTLRQQLDILDQVSAPSEMRIMENARPMLGLTEVLTHLMYCLRSGSSDPEQKWITKAELDTLVNNQALNKCVQGLLYQRLCQVQHVNRISRRIGTPGATHCERPPIPHRTRRGRHPGRIGKPGFYYTASFIVNTLNRVLDIPLIVDPAFPDEVLPLHETSPTLSSISELSELVLDLIYYLNIRDHRHAMTPAIRLFVIVEI
ncbi:MAG: hypothetical protein IPL49_10790 [Saprospirales bacterium]|nr:hypothetical protein [Saprospirales bacterium]